MYFVDLHNHSLFGIDDGPKTEGRMHRMLDDAYRRGTRVICFTPHLHPGIFPAGDEARERAFLAAQAYAREKYPDLRLCLASELRYSPGCLNWLEDSRFACIGKKHVLVDFSASESAERIIQGLNDLMGGGYLPILAHAERYRNLPTRKIGELRRRGVVIQADSQSFFGGFGLVTRLRAERMLKQDLIDFVSSDAHDTSRRPPDLRECCLYIKGKKGAACAKALCCSNARHLLYNAISEMDRKEFD